MCLGSGARNANEAAIRNWKYQMNVREQKHLNKLAKYGQLKNQNAINQTNIYQGYRRLQSRSQVLIDRARRAMLRGQETALIKMAQNSKYGNLLAAGRTGRSIERIGTTEAGALGRFYAQQRSKMTELKEDVLEGVREGRRKMKTAQQQSFASVAFNPQADIAPPRPVMQNVGWAMFTDALSIGSSVATLGNTFGGESFWDDFFGR